MYRQKNVKVLRYLCVLVLFFLAYVLEFRYLRIIPKLRSFLIVDLYANSNRTLLRIPTNISLNFAVQKFLLTVDFLRLDIATFQPSILLPFLLQSDQELLVRRNITPFTNERKNVFTFGMVRTVENLNAITKMVESLKQDGFMHDQSQRELKGNNDIATWKTEHHFFMDSKDALIHLVLLKKRNNFYYASEVETIPKWMKSRFSVDDLFIGKYPTAFERFWIERVNVSTNTCPIPQPLLPFIAYLKWSRFLECNHSAKETYLRQHPSSSNEKLDSSFLAITPRLKHVFDGMVVPFWLVSGTLLGWYRQCGIIPHTSDIDFAAYIRHDPGKLLAKIKDHGKIVLLHTYGYPERAFEITVSDDWSERTDIFFVHEECDYFWYAVHADINGTDYFQLLFSKYSLCSAELLGLKVLVPCSPEAVIKGEYGSDWMTPDTHWEYKSSSRNIGKRFTWSSAEKQKLLK